ncbi:MULTISPECIES: flagellar biosynthesis anti-sigma factor FlgM [Shewanella]|jgi:negative regulator of flagellin synthesis FlgM|uniref:flagellar biosynthesis anti-sigma factor FlgM n=1 Tax=Shewanella TaxID=22 RepID=UPI000CAA84AE|nr:MULTISPECIES: flagellar biosynthesis anti-sigma factor FlgM [Shewanella]MCP3130267.1 flagellar biosynthesis anti-sigma factor FlgM [Shewanella sp. KJ2020]PIW60943.1 MAG: flagellar biosynthesis anti-sigma factor FlgM [Shewanella sp. CG12_big_fil_rev_8_21_14_0_65_47_15]
MAIDISKLNTGTTSQVRSGTTKTSSEQSAQVAAKSSPPQRSDSVVITAQAQQLQGAQTKMASLPEVDQKKVAEIKQAIAEGRYKIDPEKLAANIASFEAELNDLNKE